MNDAKSEVVVVDIKIPFLSMVTLLVKWALASIPAVVILFIIGGLLSTLFGEIFHWSVAGWRV